MINEEFSEEIILKFAQSYQTLDPRQASFFIADNKLNIKILKEGLRKDLNSSETYFCFSDPSEFDYPGWMLRNFLFLLLKSCDSIRGKEIRVLSVRRKDNRSFMASRIYYVEMPPEFNVDKSTIKWTGWERNIQGKLLPKGVSMGDTMDPVKVAEHFSTLNLKLMKWRLLPNLNLDIIKKQKCLLFGAGTLGCAIARSLLSWGILGISFVDCGRVAYSNPVRQSLFTHSDAAQTKFKATAAADRLKEILPSVNSTGHVLQIPMPGHPVAESMRESTLENIHKIVDLIKEHEVLFLLTDSRESRWLGTMLGAFYGKVRMLFVTR
jgi:ubiquitin-like modifier-activating enzyme ATG7